MWRIRSPKSNAAQQVLGDEIARATTGEATAAVALKEASDKIAKILQ